MKYILFLTFLLNLNCFAALKTKIDLVQQNTILKFEVTLKNNTNQNSVLQLTSKAQITQFGNIKLSKNKNGDHIIQLMNELQGFIHYQIPVELKKSYFMSGLNVWHPVNTNFPDDSVFEVQAHLMPGFQFITSATGYSQESLSYVFGQFKKYSGSDKRLNIFLSKDDSKLATILLENLKKYLDHFENQIGTYPYDSFAVVEAPDEIGFAFPKMTWMGSQLLRFPFILKTSLPHELLHSWWGTSVFVDYDKGNWCEGLTTFGADYGLLSSEEKKLYRIKALTSYLNYVKNSQELSLAQFISRGEDRSLQALGYDKSLMVFVMLEQLVGESNFALGLKTFYSEFKFKKASWNDIFNVMSRVSDQNLDAFKSYWIQKPGFLAQDFLELKKKSNFVTAQTKKLELKKIPKMTIQTLIHSKNKTEDLVLQVANDGEKLEKFQFSEFSTATQYSLDPQFYLFRDLTNLEKPLNFSQFFGATETYFKFTNSDWLSAFDTTFKNKKWKPIKNSIRWEVEQNLILDLSSAVLFSEIKKALELKNISISNSNIQFENQSYDLKKEAIFISLRVQNTNVVILSLNAQLPIARWLARWSRYGGQSYVILNANSASAQGVWLDLHKVPLKN